MTFDMDSDRNYLGKILKGNLHSMGFLGETPVIIGILQDLDFIS